MRASFRADGEVLIVSGGASGIGAALAEAYVGCGGTAVVLDVERGVDHERQRFIEVDVASRDAVTEAIDTVLTQEGRIDALVCAAAVQPRVDVVATGEAVWRNAMAVNIDGVVWCCQAVLPQMIESGGGSIVLFSSGLATQGRAQAAAYAASKGAVHAFAKSLAAEVASDGVRVNVVYPGVIDTPQFRRANQGAEYEHWRRTTGIGEPADVVGPLLFLLSDAASMTGSVLSRDRAFPRR